MKTNKSLRRFGLCLVLSALAAQAPAQTGGPYELAWSTLDGGGHSLSAGGLFGLSGTIGQADAQVPPVMSGGPFELAGGFWVVAQVCTCLGDMDGDGERNAADIQKFSDCLIAGGSCSCADVDGVNGLTLADVNAFAADLLAGADCP
jgi:hypothetical protein